jgi:hypothetical protein
MRMTAEELTANRRAAGPVVRLAIACRVAPVAMATMSVGFALIAALWLTLGTARADGVALIAAIAVFVTGHAGRVLAGPAAEQSAAGGAGPAPAVEWGLTACGVLAEAVIYAGIAAAVGLHPASAFPAGTAFGSAFVTRLGGTGSTGVWRLAIIAVILALLLPVVDASLHGTSGKGTTLRAFGVPGDVRPALWSCSRAPGWRSWSCSRVAWPRSAPRLSTAPGPGAAAARCAPIAATAGSRSGSAGS